MTEDLTSKGMTEQEFLERLLANPQDSSADFLAALQGNPAREARRAEAREFDAWLRRGLNSVSAPAELRQKLLHPARLEAERGRRFGFLSGDSFIRRALPIAACLLIAIGIGIYSRASASAELEREVFSHVYQEAKFLENGQVLATPELQAKLAALGARLEPGDDTDTLKVIFAQNCWIARQIAIHLIMQGQTGAVSVMMIPNSPVPAEFNIADERFNGLVTPTTSGGSLVVIGEKQEPIVEYRNLLSRKLKWEY